jgi:hypothetical protein
MISEVLWATLNYYLTPILCQKEKDIFEGSLQSPAFPNYNWCKNKSFFGKLLTQLDFGNPSKPPGSLSLH